MKPTLPALVASTVIALWAPASVGAPVDHPGYPPGYTAPTPGMAPGYGGCSDDSYEPDSLTSPQMLPPGRIDNLMVCAGNDDSWQIQAEPGLMIRVKIEFSHAAGDVDMTFHRGLGGEEFAISDGVTNFEELFYRGTTSEILVLKVYGYDGATNRYSITLEVDDFSESCTGDDLEPNDIASTPAEPAAQGSARICLSDEDWYAVDLAPGEGFDFGIDFDSRLSDLELRLYDAADLSAPIDTAHASNQSAIVVLEESPAGGRYLVQISADGDGYNRYAYSIARYEPGAGVSGVVTGRVDYEDQLRGDDVVIGAQWTRWLPAREVPVELVRAADNRVIASTLTDERGAYSLAFSHRADGDAHVRVSARLDAPGYKLRVLQHEETRLGQFEQSPPLAALARSGATNYQHDFRFAQDSPLGGAFNIVDRCLDAFRFIETFNGPSDLDLTIIWQRGRAHECTSCFDDDTIYLGGGFDDPDEYDDSVILHEFGHFFVHELSHDDSPGGTHNGDRTNPLVAYGEGIATIFSMMVEDSYTYVDTMTSGGLFQDFEIAAFEEVRGTSTGTITGLVSEYLVVALIWDLADAHNERHDEISVGSQGIMRVLLEYMPTAPDNDQGFQGSDLADFIEGFRSLYPQYTAELDRSLAFYRFAGGNIAITRPRGSK